MRVLIIKTSSLGDVVHTLPAVTDAAAAIPGLRFDWVVEEGFARIPAWHPAVDHVIPVAMRRWRKAPIRSLFGSEWRRFKQQVQQHAYDAVIDAQGLIKSAWLSRQARGPRYGLDKHSAREPLSARFYHKPLNIPRKQHAIERVRQLFALSLGYTQPGTAPDYGLGRNDFLVPPRPRAYLVFLHGTTWATKHWPESSWNALAKLAGAGGFDVLLPWGNDAERARAERIAGASQAEVLPRTDLDQLAGYLAHAAGIVAVDTGLGHLGAALGTPGITVYGATEPGLTGTVGNSQLHLQSSLECAPCLQRQCHRLASASEHDDFPCYEKLSAPRVWEALTPVLRSRNP